MTMVLDVSTGVNSSQNQGVGVEDPQNKVRGRRLPQLDERFKGRMHDLDLRKPEHRA